MYVNTIMGKKSPIIFLTLNISTLIYVERMDENECLNVKDRSNDINMPKNFQF